MNRCTVILYILMRLLNNNIWLMNMFMVMNMVMDMITILIIVVLV